MTENQPDPRPADAPEPPADAPEPEGSSAPSAPGAPGAEHPSTPGWAGPGQASGQAGPGQASGQGGSPPPSYTQPAYGPPTVPGPPAVPPPYGGPPPPGYYSPPGPLSPDDQRMWATLAHLSGLVFHVLGALVIYLVFKDRGAFVRSQAAEALNFWITVDLALVMSFFLIIVLVGILGLVLIPLAAIVLSIVAAIAANRGEDYRYPATLRLVH